MVPRLLMSKILVTMVAIDLTLLKIQCRLRDVAPQLALLWWTYAWRGYSVVCVRCRTRFPWLPQAQPWQRCIEMCDRCQARVSKVRMTGWRRSNRDGAVTLYISCWDVKAKYFESQGRPWISAVMLCYHILWGRQIIRDGYWKLLRSGCICRHTHV